jgi:hypothetical protein
MGGAGSRHRTVVHGISMCGMKNTTVNPDVQLWIGLADRKLFKIKKNPDTKTFI